MGTTADKLNKILESKAAIKAAIEAKGVSDVGDVLAEYPDKIASISGGGGGKFVVPNGLKFGYSSVFDATQFDTSQVTDMDQMFSYYRGASLDLSSLDTSNVTNMGSIFSGASTLKNINMKGIDTSKVTTFRYSFSNCQRLSSIDLSDLNVSSVTELQGIFYGCGATSIILNNWDVRNVTDFKDMFYNCYKLTSVDLSGFITSSATTLEEMFRSCSAITSIDVSNFDTSNVTNMNYMFYGCKIIESLDLSSFNLINLKYTSGMFESCAALTNLLLPDLGHNKSSKELDLTSTSVLTKESVLYLFNNAFDRKAAEYTTAFTIKLNATTKALLTDDEIAIATNKGFTVV